MPDGGSIVVGRDLSGVRRFERAILYGFAAALAIVAAAGFAAGLVLNVLILRRVDAIAATAERIAAGRPLGANRHRRPARPPSAASAPRSTPCWRESRS